MSSLLATKLYLPSPPPRLIQRPHLIRRLNEGLELGRRLTLVSAPAGFGKSTCVRQWISGLEPGTVSWLSLDAGDNDPERFLGYFAAALQPGSAPHLEALEATSASQVSSFDSSLTLLLNDLQQAGRRLILVLDDFHVIREPLLLKAFQQIVANQSPNLHLVLVTREDPQLPLARLRAHNLLTEIRAGDLRFSGAEAGQFLNGLMELALSEEAVSALEARTEGWVAGLQLAGLSMRGRADPANFIASLTGSHRYILSYLTEEVLSRQTEDVQDFLLKTSLLDKLSAGLCEAVTGRADSGALLERLFAANLFLISLDDANQWYRYHHLFAELMRSRLKQTQPAQEVSTLHCAASEWLAQNGSVDEAIQHALAARDLLRAARLVEQAARTMIYTGRVETLRTWLNAFPETCFQANTRLTIYRAWIDLLQGRVEPTEAAIQEKEKLLEALPASPENDALRVELIVAMCRFLPLQGGARRTIRLAREALAVLPENEPASRARVIFAMALAYALEGEAASASQAFQDSLRLASVAREPGLTVQILALQAQDCLYHARLHEAERLYRSIVDLAVPAEQEPFYAAGAGYIGLAEIAVEWNDLAAAEGYLHRGLELCRQGRLDNLYRGYLVKSRLLQARGDLQGALEENRLLEQAYANIDDPYRVGRWIQVYRALGDLEGVARCAAPLIERLANPNGTSRIPRRVLGVLQPFAIRALLALGETGRALEMLDELQAAAEWGGESGPLIEACLLRALAYRQRLGQGDAQAAIRALQQALRLAEPEGYVQLFVSEGPALAPLLEQAEADPSTPGRVRGYARRLLEAFPQAHPRSSRTAEAGIPAGNVAGERLVEPLTPRELEVMRLIDAGASNREIASQLVITLSAVKKHTGNIFGKLGVNSRTQAIARARQLGLMGNEK